MDIVSAELTACRQLRPGVAMIFVQVVSDVGVQRDIRFSHRPFDYVLAVGDFLGAYFFFYLRASADLLNTPQI